MLKVLILNLNARLGTRPDLSVISQQKFFAWLEFTGLLWIG